ncbi:MAG: alkaline phosphatase family protein [Microthrixaceae bacterium]
MPSEPLTADRAEEVLCGEAERHRVDMVLRRIGRHRYRAASADGWVEFARRAHADDAGVDRYHYDLTATSGRSPLQWTGSDRRLGTDAELAPAHPDPDGNSFPFAFDQIAQFFDSRHAPDLVVQHHPSHCYGDNIGQHGSLGVVQARAPFFAAGSGLETRGVVEGAARMVDIAPTVMHLLGGSRHPSGVGPTGARRHDALLARQDGDPMSSHMEYGGARHVVVVLLDGCNHNELTAQVTAGRAPNLGLIAREGFTMRDGLIASMPTATLANHTTACTGAHPGHSGVLHNMWMERGTRHTPDLLALDQVADAMRHLHPEVETVHEAVHRSLPDSYCAALFEFCDRGADFSSFAGVRRGHVPATPDLSSVPYVHADMVASSEMYGFMSAVDEVATRQAVDQWRRGADHPLPTFTFLSLALTDEAGHESGPHSPAVAAAIVESDHRIGRLFDAVDSAGAWHDTAVLVIADHGMEGCDPTNAGRATAVLDECFDPTSFTDVADGFVYLHGADPARSSARRA